MHSKLFRTPAAVALVSAMLLMVGQPANAQNPPIHDSQPALSYSHYFLGPLDRVNSVEVGVDGSLYVAGVSLAKSAVLDPSQLFPGGGNAFVGHLSGDGSKVLYLTYLDKSGLSEARSLAVDGAGNVFVTGTTRSEDFPTLHALRSDCTRNDSGQCRQDAFVAKLDTKGATVFATRLGATGDTAGNAIGLDDRGNIFVGGSTNAYDFATRSAAQTAPGGSDDAFVASLSGDGSQVRFVSYLGGSSSDEVRGLAVTRDGAIIVTGATSSSDFPIHNAFQSQCRTAGNFACDQAFVAELSADGTKFEYSSYLGGSAHNTGNAVAVDAEGFAYVAGTTDSADFPGLRSAQAPGGSHDAFVAKIAPDGSSLKFAALLGGKGSNRGNAIAVDFSGTIHVAGSTQSLDFPTHNPLQSSCGKKNDGTCSVDGFVATLDSEGKQLEFSTYLGGQNSDVIRSIAVDRQGSAYVAGWTSSPDFPTFGKSTTAQTGKGKGGSFVAKISGMGRLNPQVTCGNGTNNWTGTAGDNQWTSPTNWSSGAVPVAADNVCIASTFTGTISVGSLNAANQTIASLNSGAPLSFQSGPLTISGTAAFAADLNVSAGYWTLGGASTMTTLELTGGILAGSGNFTISGLLTWSYGYMCTVQSGGSCTAPGTNAVTNANGGISFSGNPLVDGRTVNTAGTMTNSSSTSLYMYDGSIISNPSGATWKLGTNAFNIYDQGGTGTNTFNNAGALQVTGVAQTYLGPAALGSSGSVTITASGGSLYVSGTISGAGSWAVSKGATLTFNSSASTSTLTGIISGAGNVIFQSGTITLAGKAKSYNITGSTSIAGATSTFNAGVVAAVGSPLTISSGVAEFLTNNIKARVMNLTGGVYSGTGTLTISGLLNWSYGYMCTVESAGQCTAPPKNAVTSAKGGISFPGGTAIIDGRTLNTYKTSSNPNSSQVVYMYDGSVIANQAKSTWNLINSINIYDQGGTGTNKFTNAGTFEATGGGSYYIGLAFGNTATTSVVSVSGSGSNLSFNGALSGAGSWAAATGATLTFSASTNNTLTGPISGAGNVAFQGGTIILAGAANSYNVSGSTTISGATTTFSNGVVQNLGNPLTISGGVADFQNNVISVPSMTLSGGVYAGTGALTVSGVLNWTYGEMCTTQSAGSCTVPASNAVTNANGGIQFGGGTAIIDGRTLNTAQTSNNPISNQAIYMYDGSIINNQSGATWNLMNTFNIYDQGGTGTNVFNNVGTLEMTGSAPAYVIGPAFNNPGAVSCISVGGELVFNGATAGAGTWAVGSGSYLAFGGATSNITGSVSGAGAVIFSGGASAISGPANSYNITGATYFDSGVTTFGNGVVQSVGSPLQINGGVADFQNNTISVISMNIYSGVYAGTGTLTISSTLNWANGEMCTTQSAGSCTVPASNAITNANGGIQFGGGTAYIDGRTLNTTGNSSNAGGSQTLYMYDGSIINNQSGATWNLVNGFNIYDQGGTGTNTFNNAGTLQANGGSSYYVSPAFNNNGSVSVASSGSTFTFAGAYNQTAGSTAMSSGGALTFNTGANLAGGSFSGTGAVTGPISNTAGAFAPGTPTTAGTITLSGSSSTYSQGSGASYNVKIGGTQNSQFDRTLVGGAATLGGTLNITLINGYTPPSGTNFTIMTYASGSGQFSTIPSGWSVTYKSGSVVLTKN